ncbi:MAG TPA: xanthine dehydrogenase family protein subunit M [Miltoncostaeaceae bacterium]|nr:xanthine dehydrogenase family protein subunit M [Miltoncostaeaceae bacterium]
MLPARFDYLAPASLDEALSILAERGEDAKVLAGGQSLIPLMKFRLAQPAVLVDLGGVPGLDGLEEDGEALRIGAMRTTASLADDAILRERYPAMATAAPLISDPIIRNRGTIGGSLAHADAAGDWGSVMLALGAEVVARSASRERTIPIDDLFLGTFTTCLEPDELITEVRVPRAPERSGGTYLKLERKVGDYATVAAAVQVEMSNGHVGRAGIALTAVGATNIRCDAAEAALAGAEPTGAALDEAARLAAEAADPWDDIRGSAAYKRQVARVFVRRGLARAVEIARGD